MPSSCWSPAQRRAVGLVLALSGIACALALRVHAPLLAVALIASVSLAGVAACLRRAARRSPPPAGEVGAGPSLSIVRVADDQPLVFCAGWVRPRVFVSTGALFDLPDDELRALVVHQRHHARRRDPLRLLAVHALADGLPFLPGVRRLAASYQRRVERAAPSTATNPRSDDGERGGTAGCPLGASDPPEARAIAPAAALASAAGALASLVALSALGLHVGAVLDLSALDPNAPAGQLCLVTIGALVVLGGVTAADGLRGAPLEP